MKSTLRILFLLCLIAISCGAASAQLQLTTGIPPWGSFARGPIDTLNEGNMNIHLAIPIIDKPGRGTPVDLAITFDSGIWSSGPVRNYGNWTPLGYGNALYNFNGALTWMLRPLGYYTTSQSLSYCYTGGYISGYISQSQYTWYDPTGTPHTFPNSLEFFYGTCGTGGGGSAGTAYDGSGDSMVVSASGAPTITDKHGRQFALTVSNGGGTETDTNGNQLTWNGSVLTDTLGQAALTWAGSGNPSSPYTFTYTATSGQPATYTVKMGAYILRTNFGCSNIYEFGAQQNITINNVSEIDLPDQATNPSDKYTFTYEATPGYPGDTTGRLASVTLPTGGTISYTYAGGNNGINCYDGTSAILTRTTPDGATTYAHSVPSTSPVSTTTVTDPLNNQTVVNFERIGPSGTYQTDGFEIQRYFYQGSSTLLGTTLTCYNGTALPCNINLTGPGPFVITQTSVYNQWPNGQESETNTIFDSSQQGLMTHDLVIEKDEYGYGNGGVGPLLRKTLTSYAGLSNNILDRPSQVSVYNGPGTLVAQTKYAYDGSSVVPSGVTTQHVSVSGSRGNLTSVSRWLNTTNNWLTSTNTYFDTGMVNVAYDAKNNPTTYAYSSTYAGAYPTTIANALNQSTTNTYDVNSGLLTSTKDANSQTTSDHYDLMLRPTEIDYPDGSFRKFQYYPQQGGYTASINESNLRATYVWVDGLDRQRRVAVSNGESLPYDETQNTCLDADGRVSLQGYPFQDGGWSSSISCSVAGDTYQYDALNRPTRVTHTDGSAISTSYSGNSATVTDPEGKTRETFTDGLGRLSQVIENPGGNPSYTTTYSYDALDNLTGVVQNGSHQRSFGYDSLSRLTSETNPESGATNYTYDGDGNVATRTDARSITTTYSYDQLNRLTSRTYSDGTPGAYFYYDQSSWAGYSLSNGIGRLTSQGVYNGSNWLASSGFSYDALGRVTNNPQWTAMVNSVLLVPYVYDLIGDVTAYGNAAGITFSQTFNVGGRATGLTSNWVDSQHPGTLVSGAHYIATGAPSLFSLGNGVTQTAAYNGLLQPCRLNANTSGTQVSSCTASIPPNNLLDLTIGYGYGGGDNGNVYSFVAAGHQTFSRAYGYDALNRLATMAAWTDTCSGLSWTYDAWGNRTDQTVTSGTCVTFHQAVDGNNHFTASPYTYDAAGNMTHDASHSYTYDAENHITKVDGGSTATYGYDVEGRRTSRVVAGVETDYFYDLAGHPITEYGGGCGATCWWKGNIYFNGQMVAEYFGGTDFVTADHLGSARLLTGYPTPSVVECDDYYPFGESISCGSSGTTTHKFTGYERDTESNLDNAQARYYTSTMGRFMSPDPVGIFVADATNPQSWNLYAYASNSPLVFTDPTGKECVWDDGSFDAANDIQTGSVSGCQNAGGTWVELGQNGNWSSQANTDLQNLVSNIQNGDIGSVTVTTQDGTQYTTNYNNSGQVTQTITPNGSVLYGYSKTGSGPSQAGLGLVAVGEGACVVLEPCGAGEAAGVAIFGGLFLGSEAVIDLSKQFAKGGDQNILPSWAEGERPRPGESARDFAKRLCDAHFGVGNYNTGPGSDFSKIKKWASRKFGI